LNILNKEYLNRSLPLQLLDARLAHVLNSNNKILVTSSFGTTSAILLHAISRVKPGYPIHFINTHFHFEETISYKNQLSDLLGLTVIDVTPDVWRHQFTVDDETWKKDPDFCCQINKVEPLEALKKKHNIWMSGLMGFQNRHRSNFNFIEEKEGIYKYYPVLDWTPTLVNDYFEQYGLPQHPLESMGYGSIGCTPCTKKGVCRAGRWANTGKTECGLHL